VRVEQAGEWILLVEDVIERWVVKCLAARITVHECSVASLGVAGELADVARRNETAREARVVDAVLHKAVVAAELERVFAMAPGGVVRATRGVVAGGAGSGKGGAEARQRKDPVERRRHGRHERRRPEGIEPAAESAGARSRPAGGAAVLRIEARQLDGGHD